MAAASPSQARLMRSTVRHPKQLLRSEKGRPEDKGAAMQAPVACVQLA